MTWNVWILIQGFKTETRLTVCCRGTFTVGISHSINIRFEKVQLLCSCGTIQTNITQSIWILWSSLHIRQKFCFAKTDKCFTGLWKLIWSHSFLRCFAASLVCAFKCNNLMNFYWLHEAKSPFPLYIKKTWRYPLYLGANNLARILFTHLQRCKFVSEFSQGLFNKPSNVSALKRGWWRRKDNVTAQCTVTTHVTVSSLFIQEGRWSWTRLRINDECEAQRLA